MRKPDTANTFCHRSDEITTVLQVPHCTLKDDYSPSSGLQYLLRLSIQTHSLASLRFFPKLPSVIAACLLLALAVPDLVQAQPQAQQTENTTSGKTTTTQPEPPVDTSLRDMQQIAKQAEADDTKWLTTVNGKFLALYERARTGDPQGAVLILHAEGEHLNWRQSAQYLRLNLPEWGWATLTIALPDPALPRVPERPIIEPETNAQEAEKGSAEKEAAEKDDKPKNDAAPATPSPTALPDSPDSMPPEKKVTATINPEVEAQQRLQAALNYLHDQGQFNLAMIGSGVNGARAAYFIQQLTPDPKQKTDTREKPFQTLILLNARNQLPNAASNGPKPSLPETLNDPSMPVMDLYFGTDIRDATDTKRRRYHAQRKKYRVYQQIQLPESNAVNKIDDSSNNDLLLRRIRGFLQRYMRGMELPNSKINKP